MGGAVSMMPMRPMRDVSHQVMRLAGKGKALINLSERAIGLQRTYKRRLAIITDIALCVASVWLAVFLRIGEFPVGHSSLIILTMASIALALPIFHVFGVYRQVFSQIGARSIAELAQACLLYGLVFALIFTFAGFVGIPRTLGIIQPIMLFLLVAGSRMFASRWLVGATATGIRDTAPRILIYGAGSAGRQIAAALSQSREMRVVGFVDDDPSLHGVVMNGITVRPSTAIRDLAERLDVRDVLLAMPSISQRRRLDVIEKVRAIGLHVRTLPGLLDLAHGRVSISDIRELNILDLLGRSSTEPDSDLLGRRVQGKVVMVTGAGGSIGSELSRQILAAEPRKLILLDISEFALYTIHQELVEVPEDRVGRVEIIALLGSVTDKGRLNDIMQAWRPTTVFHAAAYKHVPLVEHNPSEGIRNNFIGTYVVADAAGRAGVNDVVLISTDKAVRPTNVMGATKRGAELVMQAMGDRFPFTRFAMVRFGNVLGSSGSVVPLFRRQLSHGGPLTITDRRITRYFMTIPEAAQLVMQAGSMAQGGEVFVLDMGESVKIIDLARNIVELSGFSIRGDENPDGDIEIKEIGLRPGEKLYEELLIGNDPIPSSHPKILMAREDRLTMEQLENFVIRIKNALRTGAPAPLIAILQEMVPEYAAAARSVDHLQMHRERMSEQSAR